MKLLNIEKEIIKKYDTYAKRFENDLKITKKECKNDENKKDLLDRMLRSYLTQNKYNKWKNKEITTTEAMKKAIEKNKSNYEKYKQKQLEQLEQIEKSGNFTKINIFIDWVKSKTWRT